MERDTPTPLLEILHAIEAQTGKLTAAARKLDVTRRFTLDGRLVGDIGEVLVAQHYDLVLDETQRAGHDGTTTIGNQAYRVQVKCRKASSLIGFSSVPELLMVVEFSEDWGRWKVVYNGTGCVVRTKALSQGLVIDEDGRIRRGGRKAYVDLALKDFRGLLGTVSVAERDVPVAIFDTDPH
jgi:hypothetical protein